MKTCYDFELYKKEKERKKNKNLQKKLYRMKRKIESKGKTFDYNVYKKKAAETQKIQADNKLKKEEKLKQYVHTQGQNSNENQKVRSTEQSNTALDNLYNSYLIPKTSKSIEAYQLEMFTKYDGAALKVGDKNLK